LYSPIQVLEYTLFQPGIFLNYLASPHRTSAYITPLDTFIDFLNRRAIIVEGYEDVPVVYTMSQDIAKVVAKAVEYEGEWPRMGGIRGNQVTVRQVLDMGKRVRGSAFAIESVKMEDLEGGILKTSWGLGAQHPSADQAQLAEILKAVLVGTLLSAAKGAWDVSDEWNQRLPSVEFTRIEEFLAKVWEGQD
jgi:hypothetical protein